MAEGPGPAAPSRAALVAVGDELVRGQVADAHLPWLAARLAEAGVRVVTGTLVGDDPVALDAVLRRACADADLVVVTGGLGPTRDDVTRDAVAALAGVPLRRDPGLEAALRERLARHAGVRPDGAAAAGVLRQADVPLGATVLPNPVGTAPGLLLELDGPDGPTTLVALPGPTRELRATVAPVLADLSARRTGGALLTRSLLVTGLGEPLAAERVEAALPDPLPAGVVLSYLASAGVVRVRLSATADEADVLADLQARAAAALGHHVAAHDADDLARVVLDRLLATGTTIGAAESLTGGALVAALVAHAGASAAVRGGVVAYATDLKADLLGVPQRLLDTDGPVAAATAAALAQGARLRCGADLGVATTGVAGPEPQGGRPVGEVHVAVAAAPALLRALPPGATLERAGGPGAAGPGAPAAVVRTALLPGDRDTVRALAVTMALALAREVLDGVGEPLPG